MDREELINGYFEGGLDESQQLQFSQLMRRDSEFAKEVAYREQVRKAIHLEERVTLKSKLQSFERRQESHLKNSSIRKWLSAAAAILIVGMSAIWWYNNNAQERLYDSYYETFPNIVQPLVRGENITDGRSKAFLSYDKGQYERSAELFSQSDDATELFYGALSEMELGEHQKALLLFDRIDASGTALGRYVRWYQALNLLKLRRRDEAQEILSVLEREKDFELAGRVSSLRKEIRP